MASTSRARRLEKATGFLFAALGMALAATCVVVAQAGEETRSPAPTLLELSAKTRAARLAGDEDAWLELARATLALAPEHPDLQISAARAAAAKGSKQDVLLHLSDAVRRGAGFDPVELIEFSGLLKDRSLESVFAAARANLAPVARAEEFARIDDADLRPEGITYDPKTSRLFVGSARGEIWQIDSSGRSAPFVRRSSGLREVYGLKVDERRRLLWAATAVFPDLMSSETAAKPDAGITGLLAFDLDTGRKREEHWLDERPTIHAFNDLAVTQLGEVFATDSATGSVYRLQPDTHRFYVVATGADMTFPNGIVLSEDESHLHVAHVEGISRIDLRTGARARVRVADTISVNSIDGLARAGRSLIGIQGSPYLSRVIRIDLAEEGRSVGRIVVLSSRTPRELAQTTAVVAGRFVYVIAGSAAVNLQTTTSNADRPVRPVILRIDMDQAP